MNISIFGLGYVGCVSAACFAKEGHQVIGIDINQQKVDLINSGQSTIIETNLEDVINTAVANKMLNATTDFDSAVKNTDVSMICVGTPNNKNGSIDMTSVKKVCQQTGTALAKKKEYHVVVIRSTVLPGTTEQILIPILEEYSQKKAGSDFGVCMNPEFMREGVAIEDFYNPDLIIIGEFDNKSGEIVELLYQNIEATIINTSVRLAEMIKYANNAFHALKVSFANEIGVISKAHDIDGRQVMDILCRDTRLNISPAYLKPGFAFGGSCLPKDLRALLSRAKEMDVDCLLLNSILMSNQQQIQRGIDLVEKFGKKKIGIIGLNFKAGTDDMRESPIIKLIEVLLGRGYDIQIFDELVNIREIVGKNKILLDNEIPQIASLINESIENLLEWAEIIVVAHKNRKLTSMFNSIDNNKIIIDFVGINENSLSEEGIYEAICW